MSTAVDAVERTEILIIGAGPAGSVAAAMLRQQGRQVLMLERQQFPRFSIGESLLPQSMEYIEAAGLLQDVVEAGFQYKNGAAFVHGEARTAFASGRSSRRAGVPPTRCSAPTSTTCWHAAPSAWEPRCVSVMKCCRSNPVNSLR